MGLFIHLVLLGVMVLVNIGVSYGRSRQCGESDEWCEYPTGSRSYRCCSEVPNNVPTDSPVGRRGECPIDRRDPGNCGRPTGFGGFARPPPTTTPHPLDRCYHNRDCHNGLLCCYDACFGQVCKNPVVASPTPSGPVGPSATPPSPFGPGPFGPGPFGPGPFGPGPFGPGPFVPGPFGPGPYPVDPFDD